MDVNVYSCMAARVFCFVLIRILAFVDFILFPRNTIALRLIYSVLILARCFASSRLDHVL